ncbi:MAG TPA: hypothetical protein VJ728_18105 [Candidatus Binataceae bacterium]|nr:hypothetical protein [Candidatus Binataceae bacterium]
MRNALKRFALELQRNGEIPSEVATKDLEDELEQYVEPILAALQRHPRYAEWQCTGHLREHLDYLVRRALNTGRTAEPAVTADQITYINPETGHGLTPTWQHRNCGGTVYVSEQGFRCNRCKRTGELGAELPEGLSQSEQMEYGCSTSQKLT